MFENGTDLLNFLDIYPCASEEIQRCVSSRLLRSEDITGVNEGIAGFALCKGSDDLLRIQLISQLLSYWQCKNGFTEVIELFDRLYGANSEITLSNDVLQVPIRKSTSVVLEKISSFLIGFLSRVAGVLMRRASKTADHNDDSSETIAIQYGYAFTVSEIETVMREQWNLPETEAMFASYFSHYTYSRYVSYYVASGIGKKLPKPEAVVKDAEEFSLFSEVKSVYTHFSLIGIWREHKARGYTTQDYAYKCLIKVKYQPEDEAIAEIVRWETLSYADYVAWLERNLRYV